MLELVGGFLPEDIITSHGENADQVLQHIDALQHHMTSDPEEALFIFYYTGHAESGELRLGETRLPLVQLKRRVEDFPTPIKIALLDSCRSGGITTLKGAPRRGTDGGVGSEGSFTPQGMILITASSAREDAQESDAIQGSLFYPTPSPRDSAAPPTSTTMGVSPFPRPTASPTHTPSRVPWARWAACNTRPTASTSRAPEKLSWRTPQRPPAPSRGLTMPADTSWW